MPKENTILFTSVGIESSEYLVRVQSTIGIKVDSTDEITTQHSKHCKALSGSAH